MSKNATIGLVVPHAEDKVPAEGHQMYPGQRFIPKGVGVRSLTPEGYATGSPGLTGLGRWRMAGQDLAAEPVWQALRQPDLVARARGCFIQGRAVGVDPAGRRVRVETTAL